MIKKTFKLPIYVVLFVATILFAFVVSCNNDSEESKIDEELKAVTEEDESVLDSENNMGDIMENLSSPVEMAALIKDNNVPFSLKYLSNPDNIDNYSTKFEQALGLGILGADLGYLNIYNRTTYVMRYISAISKLSEALSINQFFDFETLKRLATNNENLDSLIYISTSSFNRMDKYLRERNRADQSILIITGVWIEAMYQATQVVKEKHNEKIAERIGEQKLILSELINTLKRYQSKKAFKELLEDLAEINKIYDKIEIDYQVGEPETVEIDGRLIIMQNETSIVNMSAEQLNQIISIIESIRNKRIQLNN
jgi:hypothetical protein